MADYVAMPGGGLFRAIDQALIPESVDNADYQRYLAAVGADPEAVAQFDDWINPNALRDEAASAVDIAAEAARQRYVTPGAGQALTYQEKVAQAQAYQAAGAPEDPAPWPFIVADATAFGITPAAAATAILSAREAWIAIGAQIEGIRLLAKRLIAAAETTSALTAARDVAINQLREIDGN
jgi:hypothetical protein